MGINVETNLIRDYTKKEIISLSGPFFSLFLFFIMNIFGRLFNIYSVFYRFFCLSNLAVGIINLFPVFPLDGASFLKSLFSKRFGIISGFSIFLKLTVFFYVLICTLSAVLIIFGIFSPFIFAVTLFTLFSLKKEKELFLIEKKAVLSGDIVSKEKEKIIKCSPDCDFLYLASKISSEYTLKISVFSHGSVLSYIYQDEIIYAIRKYGALISVKEYIEKERKILYN